MARSSTFWRGPEDSEETSNNLDSQSCLLKKTRRTGVAASRKGLLLDTSKGLGLSICQRDRQGPG